MAGGRKGRVGALDLNMQPVKQQPRKFIYVMAQKNKKYENKTGKLRNMSGCAAAAAAAE